MHRRALLQSLGFSLLAPWAPRLLASPATDPLSRQFQQFAVGRARHPLLAGFASVDPAGVAEHAVRARGRWPQALRGQLLRNGPGLFDRGGQRYTHWFDGDGLIQRWQVADGGVRYAARFVATPKFQAEQRSGRFEYAVAGTRIPDARPVRGPDDLNVANTALLAHAGKVYALWEAGSAFEIDPDTLHTLGPKSYSEALEGVPFSAHPLRAADGEVWNYGHFGRQLVIYRLGTDGALRDSAVIELPVGGYLHSFAMTDTRLVFVLAPLVPGEFKGSFFESLRWRPEQGSTVVVVDKANLRAKPRLLELDAGVAYHYADAWDESDGGIGLRACWVAEGAAAISPMAHLMRGDVGVRDELEGQLVHLAIPPTGHSARIAVRGERNVEFPAWTGQGRRGELWLLAGSGRSQHGLLDSLLQVGPDHAVRQRWRAPAGVVLEEHLPIRGRDDSAWLVGTAFDTRAPATGVLLFDACAVEDGPVAEAWLDQAMPLGFHGVWRAG